MDHFYSARGQRRPVPRRSVITRDPSLFSEVITVAQTDSGKPTRRGWFILPYFIHTHERSHTYKCTLAVFYICTRANALLYFTHTYRDSVNVFYTHACMHACTYAHSLEQAHMHACTHALWIPSNVGDGAQSLVHAKQALCHWAMAPFLFSN